MPRHREEEPEITAQPKRLSDELPHDSVAEPGLSIDPEDLGRQFLNDATEQANHESFEGGDTPELGVTTEPPNDEAMVGPNFDPDHSIWEQTVDLALEHGGVERMQEEASHETNEQNQGLGGLPRRVDVVSPVIDEGSMLDEEGEELGEVESPDVHTDEMGDDDRRRQSADEGLTRRPAPRRQSS